MKLRLSPAVAALNPGIGTTIETKDTQARTPRAPSDARVGLTALLVCGWNVQSYDCVAYRLYRGALDTGTCATLKEACQRAKELEVLP